jgi:acyl carrier protein
MAARSNTQLGERWKASGVEMLAPADALGILGRSLEHRGAQLAVFDFRKLTSRLPAAELPRILCELAPAKRAVPVQRQSELVRKLAEAEFADRTAMLAEYLKEQSTKALGLRAPLRAVDESLIAMGVDSLMALEIRTAVSNELGKDIPIVRFLDGSAIADLAALLATQFEEERPAVLQPQWVEGEI